MKPTNDAKVFSRRGTEKDERAQDIEDAEIARLEKDQNDQIRSFGRAHARLRFVGRTKDLRHWSTTLESGQEISSEALSAIPQMYWNVIDVDSDLCVRRPHHRGTEEEIQAIRVLFQEKIVEEGG